MSALEPLLLFAKLCYFKAFLKKAMFVPSNFRVMPCLSNIEFFSCTCSLVNNIRLVKHRIFQWETGSQFSSFPWIPKPFWLILFHDYRIKTSPILVISWRKLHQKYRELKYRIFKSMRLLQCYANFCKSKRIILDD